MTEFEKARDEAARRTAEDMYVTFANKAITEARLTAIRVAFQSGSNWAKEWCEKEFVNTHEANAELLKLGVEQERAILVKDAEIARLREALLEIYPPKELRAVGPGATYEMKKCAEQWNGYLQNTYWKDIDSICAKALEGK